MKYLAILVLVLGCGKSADKSGGGSGGSWTIGGLKVPESTIPKKLGAPTVMPKKIGDTVTLGESNEMTMVIPEQLNVSYILGEPPNDDMVRGYSVMIYADPMADLEAAWGPFTEKDIPGWSGSKCWTATDQQLETCVTHSSGQNHWTLRTVTTAAAPDRPLAPIAPEPAGTYADFPVGIGPCNVAGIQEISQIVGAQLQYLDPKAGEATCMLLPATDQAASRTGGQVTAAEAAAQVPTVLVRRQPAASSSWSDAKIEGLGDKATWEGNSVQFQIAAVEYRVNVADHRKEIRWLKDRALQIAHRVAARARALPAE